MSATLATEKESVKVDTYNKTQIAAFYGVSIDTLNAWTGEIPGFGKYTGRRYTLRQVEMIFEHCGKP